MEPSEVGSVWRRWDLHFHTPSSFDYGGPKGTTSAELVEGLTGAGVSVVAVTDHNVVDSNRIREMRDAAGDALTVLPGIELRTELGGSDKVHLVAIFPDTEDLDHLSTQLQVKLRLTRKDFASKGETGVWVRFEEACDVVHELGGFTLVHAGTKSNSFETCLPSRVPINQIIKTDLVLRHVDAYELGKPEDRRDYVEKIFKFLKKDFPLIIGSDNHDIRTYGGGDITWIKADPNYLGLRQTVNEPLTRIYLGPVPPQVQRVASNSTKYLRSIRFRKVDSSVRGAWFGGQVPLNPGLVAIIGNKGSGKSALADVIALLGNSSNQASFAFLNAEHFLRPRDGLGRAFEAEAEWMSGESRKMLLGDAVEPTSPELVKYLPQSHIEALCASVSQPGASPFELELEEVIYSHVPVADRLSKGSLRELIRYLTEETNARIAQLKRQVSEVNARILEAQQRASEEHRAALEGELAQRQAELDAHVAVRPAPVVPPIADPAAQEALSNLASEIAEQRAQLSMLRERLKELTASDNVASEKLAAATRLRTRLRTLNEEIDEFVDNSSEDLATLGLEPHHVFNFTSDEEPIAGAEIAARQDQDSVRRELDPEADGSVAQAAAAARQRIVELVPGLDAPNLAYQAYLDADRTWQAEHELITGATDVPGSVTWLTSEIAKLQTVPQEMEELAAAREELLRSVYAAKQELLERYRHLFSSVQRFVADITDVDGSPLLTFSARTTADNFATQFSALIHHGRRGNFQGDREGREFVQRLLDHADHESADGTVAFARDVTVSLYVHAETGESMRLADQLVQGVDPLAILDYIWSLDYLRPRFDLLWGGRSLNQLSPGERGTLLLLFYLLVDLREIPLIIDQPEENLDNQTVYSQLVDAVRSAADRRQVVMVTHNPNLAVVCDADQVIYAHRDIAGDHRVTYACGALENPAITKFVVDVLEGTKPAFWKRRDKYRIADRAS